MKKFFVFLIVSNLYITLQGMVPVPDFGGADAHVAAAAPAAAAASAAVGNSRGRLREQLMSTGQGIIAGDWRQAVRALQLRQRESAEYEQYRNGILSLPGFARPQIQSFEEWRAGRVDGVPVAMPHQVDPEKDSPLKFKPRNKPFAGLTINDLRRQPLLAQPAGERLNRVLDRFERALRNHHLQNYAVDLPVADLIRQLQGHASLGDIVNQLKASVETYDKIQKRYDAIALEIQRDLKELYPAQPGQQQQGPRGLLRQFHRVNQQNRQPEPKRVKRRLD